MGTNFYWNNGEHIGKRSAAGLYCWDCGHTLCKGGDAAIHWGQEEFYDACPACGKAFADTPGVWSGAAAVELGFAKPQTQRGTGVKTCSSFSWAQNPAEVLARCRSWRGRFRIITDEYGRKTSGRAFVRMLECNCPIQYTDLVGSRFC